MRSEFHFKLLINTGFLFHLISFPRHLFNVVVQRLLESGTQKREMFISESYSYEI